MKILVIGSGGREHALCWKIAQSPLCEKLYCIPGNAGISLKWDCPTIKANNFEEIISFARSSKIDFTIVGPENPLVDGIVDHFSDAGLKIFGPGAQPALLEGDKAFAKELMKSAGVPTADFTVCHDYHSALNALFEMKLPAVIKVAGLAAGKGVFIVTNSQEVETTLEDIFKKRKFGAEGNTVVVEECLHGEELSIFALTDGDDYLILPPSQDHKRIGENDTGPNTGGMGAYAPAPIGTPELISEVENKVIKPTLTSMRNRGMSYRGLLYVGLMLTRKGPQVLEYNCRFGDPETQCVLPLVKGDLLEMMIATTEEGGISKWKAGHLKDKVYTSDVYAACVILASKGYPGSYAKGILIDGLQKEYEDTVVFHAGTKMVDGKILTAGGRVLGVTSMGESLENALAKAYLVAKDIKFKGKYYRRDIGHRALKK